ncbi:hypothetical protein ACFLTH_08945 [Bacteroidota bacterium]
MGLKTDVAKELLRRKFGKGKIPAGKSDAISTPQNPVKTNPYPIYSPPTAGFKAPSQESMINIFVILALIANVWDFVTSGGYDPKTFISVLWIYGPLTLFALFLVFKPENPKDIFKFVLVSILAIWLPRGIIWALQASGIDPTIAAAIFVAAPVWLVFLYINHEYSTEKIQKFAGWYFFIALIIGLFTILPSTAYASGINSEGADVGTTMDRLLDFFNPVRVGEKITEWQKSTKRFIQDSTSLNYFTGTVEKNKDEPLGVYLEDLKPASKVFYEGNPVVVWATIRGKSFEGNIKTTNGCYARKGQKIITGEVYPKNLELFYSEGHTLECIFDSDKGAKLEKGYYTVYFTSQFDFETWGYITYTYMDREVVKNKHFENQDIYSKYGIPRKATAIYTNGPAGIGIMNPDQPIAIDVADSRIPSFGATLENKWSQGEIVTINNMTIKVPEGIVFTECTPDTVNKDREFTETAVPFSTEDDMDVYLFEPVDSESVGNPSFFTTVSCRAELKDPDNFLDLQSILTTKTFAVKAIYKYVMQKSVSVKVDSVVV